MCLFILKEKQRQIYNLTWLPHYLVGARTSSLGKVCARFSVPTISILGYQDDLLLYPEPQVGEPLSLQILIRYQSGNATIVVADLFCASLSTTLRLAHFEDKGEVITVVIILSRKHSRFSWPLY